MDSREFIEKLKKINADLRAKKLLPFYYLYGNEDFFVQSLKKGIIKAFDDSTGLNVKIYTKNNFNAKDVIKDIGNLPFMNEKKLMVFDNVDFFKDSKIIEDEKGSKEVKDMIDAFENAKDINIVLFVKTEFGDGAIKGYNKDNAFLQYFTKNGISLALNKLDENGLSDYVHNRFKKKGVDIEKIDVAYFIRVCGKDLTNLYNEIDKVVAYIGDNKKVSKADIDEIATRSLDDKIYKLIDLYNTNKKEEAIRYYGDLLAEGENDRKIFPTFSYNYANLIVCKDFMERGKGQNEISELMGLETWRVRNLMSANKYVTMETLKSKMQKITDISVARMKGDVNENIMVTLLMN